jgi:hypothetical protein
MKYKKDSDLEMLKQGAQLGGGVAAGAGLKGALNSILSGGAGTVAKMLPKALGRSTGAGAVGASLMPEDISAGSTEAERKLEMGEAMSPEDYAQLDAMKAESRGEPTRPDPEEARSARHALNKMVIGRDIDQEMEEEDLQQDVEEEDFQEPDGGLSPEDAKQMRIDEMLKQLRMHNI